jgi:hypothetical protein
VSINPGQTALHRIAFGSPATATARASASCAAFDDSKAGLRPALRCAASEDMSTIDEPRHHHLERGLAEEHVAAHVDGVLVVPGLRSQLGQRQRPRDADVQHQPVEAAEPFGTALKERRDAGGVAHVGDFRECPACGSMRYRLSGLRPLSRSV